MYKISQCHLLTKISMKLPQKEQNMKPTQNNSNLKTSKQKQMKQEKL